MSAVDVSPNTGRFTAAKAALPLVIEMVTALLFYILAGCFGFMLATNLLLAAVDPLTFDERETIDTSMGSTMSAPSLLALSGLLAIIAMTVVIAHLIVTAIRQVRWARTARRGEPRGIEPHWFPIVDDMHPAMVAVVSIVGFLVWARMVMQALFAVPLRLQFTLVGLTIENTPALILVAASFVGVVGVALFVGYLVTGVTRLVRGHTHPTGSRAEGAIS